LSKDAIKNLILKDVQIGEVFYPSDIADRLGTDILSVIEAVAELKKEGRLQNRE
jgi:predicted transcriptional regulator